MSRLDAFIERLQAQRVCLGLAAELIQGVPGPVLELGLGNGRTYDHLRQLFPDRDIFVYERQPAPHPACMPPPERLIVGRLEDTLEGSIERLPAPAALVHADLGTADAERNARLAAWLSPILPRLMQPGGIVASDQRLADPGLEPLALPDSVPEGRYFFYHCRTRMKDAP